MDTATWACVQGDWDQYKGQIKKRWAKLTDDDLLHIAGDRDLLVGKLQQRYGLARERIEDQVEEFAGTAGPTPLGWMGRAKQKMATLTEKAKSYYRQHKISDMVGDVENSIRRHPVPSTLVGMSVGFLLGTLLTRRQS